MISHGRITPKAVLGHPACMHSSTERCKKCTSCKHNQLLPFLSRAYTAQFYVLHYCVTSGAVGLCTIPLQKQGIYHLWCYKGLWHHQVMRFFVFQFHHNLMEWWSQMRHRWWKHVLFCFYESGWNSASLSQHFVEHTCTRSREMSLDTWLLPFRLPWSHVEQVLLK